MTLQIHAVLLFVDWFHVLLVLVVAYPALTKSSAGVRGPNRNSKNLKSFHYQNNSTVDRHDPGKNIGNSRVVSIEARFFLYRVYN